MAITQYNTITASDMIATYYTKTDVNNLLATKKPNDNFNIIFAETYTSTATITLNDTIRNYNSLIVIGRNTNNNHYRHYIIAIVAFAGIVFLCDGNIYTDGYILLERVSDTSIKITDIKKFALDLIIGVK